MKACLIMTLSIHVRICPGDYDWYHAVKPIICLNTDPQVFKPLCLVRSNS